MAHGTAQGLSEDGKVILLLEQQPSVKLHPFVIYQAGFACDGAIREGDLVLVVDRHNTATKLYDLSQDLGQQRNLIADPERQDVVNRLRDTFLKYNDHDDSTFDEPRTTPVFRPSSDERATRRE